MIIVYTTGVFDVLHVGHISTLKRAKELGDKLIVGVQNDESVEKQKGRRPVLTCSERKATLSALPFVDDCVSYFDIDQREMLAKIKPDILVQTKEWAAQADRSVIINYLLQNNIKLVLLPIKKDISSSEIKKRVIQNANIFRNDIGILYSALDIVPISELSVYEKFDIRRTEKLCKKINKEKFFFNPITVAKFEGIRIVIDGANRLESLKRLGAKYAFVYYVDYNNENRVSLVNNAHFLNCPSDILFELLQKNNFKIIKLSDEKAAEEMNNNNFLAMVSLNNQDYYQVVPKENEKNEIEFLNDFVNLYLGKFEVYRLSELSQDSRLFVLKIIFKKFSPKDIVDLARSGRFLNSGITWHKTNESIINFNLPLEWLMGGDDLDAKRSKLLEIIELKIVNKDIRYYPSNVYVCNDWQINN